MTTSVRGRKAPPLSLPGTMPSWAQATPNQQRRAQVLLLSMERARREIVRTYRRALTVPHSLAFALESLGDEAMIGHEYAVLARYRERLSVATRLRQAGAVATRAESKRRAERVMEKNADLLDRLARGTITQHGAAWTIYTRWDKRGEGGCPALITLRRWIASAMTRKD